MKLGQEWRQEIIKEQLHAETSIEALVEVVKHELSPVQMNLFEICRGMNFQNWGCRPSWANGAHIFVLPAVANELEDAFQGVQLGKSDVVVSPELLEVVQNALAEGSGSRKSCAYINDTRKMSLKAFSRVDAQRAREIFEPMKLNADMWENLSEYSIEAGGSARLTHSTGSLPRGVEKSWGHSDAAAERSCLPPTTYKNFSLLAKLPPGEEADSAETHTVQTDLESELPEMDVLHFVLELHFCLRRRPVIMSGITFGTYMVEHCARLQAEVVTPYLATLPLESTLASASSNEHELEPVYKQLKGAMATLFSESSLETFLTASEADENTPEALLNAFDKSCELLANDLAEALANELKQLLSYKWKAWKRDNVFLPAGFHAAAEELRKLFGKVVLAACSKLSIESMASSAWSKRDVLQPQPLEKEEGRNKKSDRRSSAWLKIDSSLRLALAQARHYEKQQKFKKKMTDRKFHNRHEASLRKALRAWASDRKALAERLRKVAPNTSHDSWHAG